MQIAESYESRNDNTQKFIRRLFQWKQRKNDTEFIFLLTGDLNSLTNSNLTAHPKGKQVEKHTLRHRVEKLNEQSFEIEVG